MIKVYLLESIYEGEQYQEVLLHLEGTDIWLANSGYPNEHLEDANFTPLFWRTLGKNNLLTYLGPL